MFSRFAVVSVLALFFAVVIASPKPTPGPADPVELQRRQIDSVISQVTGGAKSLQVLQASASALTSNAASVGGDITSVGGSLGGAATSVGGNLGSAATSVGGDITSKAASAYSAATSAGAAATSNSGNPTAMMSLRTPLLAAFATIIFSTLFGAAFVL